MFSIKRLEKYSSRRTRDFVVVVVVFYESREKKKKRIEQGMETKTSIRPDTLGPVSPALLYSLPDIAWQ